MDQITPTHYILSMQSPKILDIDPASVDNVLARWRAGQLVAIPTETVYGLAADATNGQAVARIYSTKSRPQLNPLIIHVSDIAMAKTYGVWNPMAETLATRFWPGPLTLVLSRQPDSPISDLAMAGGATVALRMPAHPIALTLIRAYGRGIAAPSANRSGRVSPTTAQHVANEFANSDLRIIDGGPCQVGIESTVVDLTGDTPVILRPGAITSDMLSAAVGPLAVAAVPPSHGGAHASPGQMESHYAPSIPVRLNATSVSSDEALLAFGTTVPQGAHTTLTLSSQGDLIEAAANLFAALRALDQPQHRCIAVMPIPNTGLGEAINDRLKRASVR